MWIRAILPTETLLESDVVVWKVRFVSGPSLGRRSPSRGTDEVPGGADALFYNDEPL